MTPLKKPEIGICIIHSPEKLHKTFPTKWIDLSESLESVINQIEDYKRILTSTLDTHWFRVTDTLGFYNIPVGEFETLENIKRKADLILEYGELASHVYLKRKGDFDAIKWDLNNVWGTFESLMEFGEWLFVGNIADEKEDWFVGMPLPDKYRPFIKGCDESVFVDNVAQEEDGWCDGVPLPDKYRPYVDFEAYANHHRDDEGDWSVTLSTGEFHMILLPD